MSSLKQLKRERSNLTTLLKDKVILIIILLSNCGISIAMVYTVFILEYFACEILRANEPNEQTLRFILCILASIVMSYKC